MHTIMLTNIQHIIIVSKQPSRIYISCKWQYSPKTVSAKTSPVPVQSSTQGLILFLESRPRTGSVSGLARLGVFVNFQFCEQNFIYSCLSYATIALLCYMSPFILFLFCKLWVFTERGTTSVWDILGSFGLFWFLSYATNDLYLCNNFSLVS